MHYPDKHEEVSERADSESHRRHQHENTHKDLASARGSGDLRDADDQPATRTRSSVSRWFWPSSAGPSFLPRSGASDAQEREHAEQELEEENEEENHEVKRAVVPEITKERE